MSEITYDYMEEYIRGLISDRDGILNEIENFARENGVPIVQKETGVFLEFMTSMKKPKRILELGTAIGFSSILMYQAAGTEPEIVTIERDERMIELANVNLNKFNLSEKIKIEEGDCLEVLEKLTEPFDLIFMDAGKGHYNHFLPHCLRLLKEDGIIVADNVLFRGMVASQDLVKRRKITIVKRMRTYLELVTQDKDLITSVIPMGDGIAVTKRR
ncbi:MULTISPECIES: O-methyltransferase [Clostridium]|uniref:tRNA 5-hydroxyuridine methyltransferase n=1 Tax=Clostridium saccharoperbutylacetonicum N1-4(HMT) TaxID=931276 RepID=M1MAP4_9CLOT|nr:MULTISPECIES: O-methyltransferase [Clostridium]AGF55024.1 O-methyltransferase, family 3 [Clostridium saccharoperbutylacetonicum N1-4(HMT)]AQR93913.1 putative O-methyltransferase [Clostridium saccharoperbutylacetonicum]NRT64267.1 putative O-methyltransferase YrrM [Clostridium saccharoperbutylacetonicum]NSB27635.1 putative O-methyltransferase YrrM [Clostridium saccharoperbutylacetonicum]NSB29611.1 putative O-methyltransferase YrrM [Clostridium saccharoperbutylacetonicum]